MGYLPFETVKNKVLVRRKAETSEKHGSKPEARSAKELLNYGIVNIDKPSGPSSHQVSAYVKKIIDIKKTGHSGTLDPKVTGVLPVALGKATRIVHPLLKAGKEYICLMHLHEDIAEAKVRKVMEDFIGRISQLPPVRSAVKRRTRKRKIYYLEIIEINGKDVLFKAGTQAGTYIRKLCHDIGVQLGIGAQMAELRRTKAGPFGEESSCTLQDLADAVYLYKKEKNGDAIMKIIFPVEKGVEHLPKIWVLDTTINSLCHGASLKIPGISKLHSNFKEDDMVAIMSLKDELIMTATTVMNSKQVMEDEKGLAAKPLQVFMQPGIYPKVES